MTPISKNIIKGIRALEHRKYRREAGAFVAEGNKLVEDNIATMKCLRLVATRQWMESHPGMAGRAVPDAACHIVTREEMERVSLMQSPQDVLGVFQIPDHRLDTRALSGQLTVWLDDVQDPGNVGTIIRLCDWFGIRDIIASTGTADCYAPKVVQATMGAIARVRVHYQDIEELLAQLSGTGIPVYGTYLDGQDIYRTELSPTGIIIMGNEGRGISPQLERFIIRKLYIPSYPPGVTTSESLNVGIATAITVAEFRRRQL